jgi:hypothetical protein
MKNKVIFWSITLCASAAFAVSTFRVDSVTVDSVWNNDTTEYNQNMPRRDVKLSFVPVYTDSVSCFVDIWALDSTDTAHTYQWTPNRDMLAGANGETFFRVPANKKKSVTMCVVSGDRDSVRFRVTARPDTLSLGRLRLASAVAGWIDEPDSYNHFATASELQALMDGGYEGYFQNGLIEGFRSNDSTLTGRSGAFTVCDFGLAGRAAAMHRLIISGWRSNLVAVNTYPDSVALSYKVLGGMTTSCHFNHFFVEFTLSGYQPSDSLAAMADVKTFVDFFNQKSQVP